MVLVVLEEELVLGRLVGAAGRDFALCSTAEGNQPGGSGLSGDLGSEETEGLVLDDEAVLEEVRRPLRRLGPAVKGPEASGLSDI